MREIALAVCIVTSLTTSAGAQEMRSRSITLREAVERMQSVGFDVRMAHADARAAAADVATARATLRPQIGISANVLDANEPQLGMPIARQAYGAATLSVPLYTPANRSGARAAEQTARSVESAVLATVNDGVFATVQAYRKIQVADAVVTVRRVMVADQTTHLRVTEQRIEAGKAARYAALRDRASLASAGQALEDAASERDQAAYELAALLDLPADALSVEPLVRIAMSETRDAVLARAIRQRPSLVAAEQRVAAAESGIVAARSAYRPSATLTAQSYDGESSPALGRGGGQVLITASLPIVDGGARAAALVKAQAQYDRSVAALDQTRAGVVRDVANAWREYEAATRNLATADAVNADAQEQLRLATLRRAAGKAIEAEVLDAQSVAANARETVVRSVARYDIAIAAIHHATGDVSP